MAAKEGWMGCKERFNNQKINWKNAKGPITCIDRLVIILCEGRNIDIHRGVHISHLLKEEDKDRL